MPSDPESQSCDDAPVKPTIAGRVIASRVDGEQITVDQQSSGQEIADQTGVASNHPDEVNEAVSAYRIASVPIDTDTRLSSAGETEAMWSARPARRSVIRSLQRTTGSVRGGRETALFRGDASSSHTRRDLLTGDWTIYAPRRDQRPNDYETSAAATQQVNVGSQSDLSAPAGAGSSESGTLAPETRVESVTPAVDGCLDIDSRCPFCAGAESRTPEAVWSAKLGDQTTTPSDNATTRFARPQVEIAMGEQPDWNVRVVPNKFPAVSACDLSKSCQVDKNSLFPIDDVVGGHEVIVESGSHIESMMQQDPALVYLTLLAYRDRIRHWRDVPGISYVSVFKNCGPEAGASLRHSHSQLVATSLVPQRVRTSLLRCENHRARTGCSLGCDLLRAEMEEKSRVIDRTDSFVAFCPFASRFGGLIRMTSIEHQPYFEDMSESSLDQLASFLYRVLTWVHEAFPGKAFNYLLQTCPPGATQPDAFQWFLDVFPRLNKTAGFEWSSDCMINSLLPEMAAKQYREIARKNDPRNVLAVR